MILQHCKGNPDSARAKIVICPQGLTPGAEGRLEAGRLLSSISSFQRHLTHLDSTGTSSLSTTWLDLENFTQKLDFVIFRLSNSEYRLPRANPWGDKRKKYGTEMSSTSSIL